MRLPFLMFKTSNIWLLQILKLLCIYSVFAQHISSLRHGRCRPALVSGYKCRTLQSLCPHLLLKGDSMMKRMPVAVRPGLAGALKKSCGLSGHVAAGRMQIWKRLRGMGFPPGNVHLNAPREIIFGDGRTRCARWCHHNISLSRPYCRSCIAICVFKFSSQVGFTLGPWWLISRYV